jgi:hypothetical protein
MNLLILFLLKRKGGKCGNSEGRIKDVVLVSCIPRLGKATTDSVAVE